MQPPALQDVYAARERVYRVIRPTPLLRHPLLAQETGLDVLVKHENHNPTGAFKVRGGLNLIGSLPPRERLGVITATTGNHGQSIALACQREGVPCTIVTPLGNNPEKNAAMRAYGAELIEHGRDFDEAREKVEALQHERGLRYVHSANEPSLLAGVATYALEIFEELPDVDVILVPIGGGSGACRRVHAVVEGRHPRRGRSGGHVRGGDGDARDVRSDVRAADARARRRGDADGARSRRRRQAGATDDAQPGGRRGRRAADCGEAAARSSRRQEDRVRDERRQHRSRDAHQDPQRSSLKFTVTVMMTGTGTPF